jgi:hypothetical protein
MSWRIKILCLLLATGVVAGRSLAAPAATEHGDDFIRVELEPGTTLRGIAEKFLNDPDLWPIVLSLNGINDAADVVDGQELLVPANQVRLAAAALDSSLLEIQKANEAGAQIFAPILIKQAIGFRDRAVVESNNGAYAQAVALSSQSIKSAGEARTTSERRRDVEAEALLGDRQGWVEGQKTNENGWTERELNAVLKEQEKLRTLSESTAQVVFRDASRLRLNSNSQAVIQRLRDDPLKRRKEAQISLVEGDFYALLAPDSDRNRLEVKLADVDAQIDSGNFWMSREKGTAKLANYDIKPVAIVSGGDTLQLGRNEGAVIRQSGNVKEKVKLLGRVELDAPADNSTVLGSRVQLSWHDVSGEQGYWVEIAFDPRFDRMVDSIFGIPQNRIGELTLAPGTYYWRVAALDGLGLPGPMSTARKFEVIGDSTPPFLQIRTPEPNAVLREAAVTISGETETGAAVTVAGEVASVDKDGRFVFTLVAKEGRNGLDIVARDAAGNETKRHVDFTYVKDDERTVLYDPTVIRDAEGRFLTAGRQLDLAGTVAEGAKVSVFDVTGVLRSETYADQAGHFTVTVPLASDAESLNLKITAVSGYAYRETISVMVSERPPRFRLREPVPSVTAQGEIDLLIDAEPGTGLTVNGAAPEIRDGLAHFRVVLAPGANLIEVVATDAVGLVTIEKHTVLFDNEKPQVVDNEIVAKNLGDRDLLSIRIGATDASGLAQTSRLRLRSGETEKAGVLRYNRAKRSYHGTIEVPKPPPGSAIEVIVELADVAGNINEVKLQ